MNRTIAVLVGGVVLGAGSNGLELPTSPTPSSYQSGIERKAPMNDWSTPIMEPAGRSGNKEMNHDD